MCVSKAKKLMDSNEGLYQRLLGQELDPSIQSEIDIGEFLVASFEENPPENDTRLCSFLVPMNYFKIRIF